jgi:tetratricopeptide (TPR) repeat protein
MNAENTLERYVAGDVPLLDDIQAEALYAAGHAYYEQSDYARAADVFRLLALARPHSPRSWIALAATHEGVGDTERAMALYGIATQTRDGTRVQRAEAHVHLARAEHLLGADDEARADLARAADLADPSDFDEPVAIAFSALEKALGS